MACCKCCCEGGTPPGVCCGSPESCCYQPSHCCEDSSPTYCCAEGETCCDGACCEEGYSCCNGTCCAPDEFCCDGVCQAEPCPCDPPCTGCDVCTETSPGVKECVSSCTGGQVCCGGVCQECCVDADCPSGEVCVGGNCEPESDCTVDGDCPPAGYTSCGGNIWCPPGMPCFQDLGGLWRCMDFPGSFMGPLASAYYCCDGVCLSGYYFNSREEICPP